MGCWVGFRGDCAGGGDLEKLHLQPAMTSVAAGFPPVSTDRHALRPLQGAKGGAPEGVRAGRCAVSLRSIRARSLKAAATRGPFP